MEITKNKTHLIVKIPLTQKESNCYMDDKDLIDVPNCVGIIAGDEMTISQLNDLSYKGDQQEGGPLVHFWGEEEEFRKICKKINIDIWEHEMCDYCHKPIYGCWTMGDKGNQCFECGLKEKNEKP